MLTLKCPGRGGGSIHWSGYRLSFWMQQVFSIEIPWVFCPDLPKNLFLQNDKNFIDLNMVSNFSFHMRYCFYGLEWKLGGVSTLVGNSNEPPRKNVESLSEKDT